jgi:hypothetical protein
MLSKPIVPDLLPGLWTEAGMFYNTLRIDIFVIYWPPRE